MAPSLSQINHSASRGRHLVGTRAARGVYYYEDAPVEGRPLDEDESELVERARDGDGYAYRELVTRYQGVAHRAAYLITRSDAEAEDATAEGFTKAYYSLHRFRSGRPFRPWVLRIVTNEARNRRRAAGRRAGLALRASRDASSGGAAPSPEEEALAEERRAALLRAVNSLRERDRVVIGYRYFLALSEAETAHALGLPKGTVKSRLFRALGRLRTALEQDPAGLLATGEEEARR